MTKEELDATFGAHRPPLLQVKILAYDGEPIPAGIIRLLAAMPKEGLVTFAMKGALAEVERILAEHQEQL